MRIIIVAWQDGATPTQGDTAASIGADALATSAEQAMQRWLELDAVTAEAPTPAIDEHEQAAPQAGLALAG